MHLYLPIAEVSVNPLLLLGIGAFVGLMSGMFGVGGGFLITPLMFFIGIPPGVAVASAANQIVASSVSAILIHIRRKTVDFRMGWILLGGGFVGSFLGIWIFNYLKSLGQIDLFVRILYVVLLGGVGALMFVESLRAILRARGDMRPLPKRHVRGWVSALPFRMKFRVSGLYISVIPPLLVGGFVGFLAAIMGVGGGFIMVPAMIYILNMPTKVVVGTSLFQIIFVSALNTLLHATTNYNVDMVLAVVLLIGGVIGAQLGATMGLRLKPEQLRILMSLLVLVVGLKLGLDLSIAPAELYDLDILPAQ